MTIFVEPDPDTLDSFSVPADAEEWGISVHFQPDVPYESHLEIARIDTTHGEPHFDRLYEPTQPKDWLGTSYTFGEARTDLLSNWRGYAEKFFKNHYQTDA